MQHTSNECVLVWADSCVNIFSARLARNDVILNDDRQINKWTTVETFFSNTQNRKSSQLSPSSLKRITFECFFLFGRKFFATFCFKRITATILKLMIRFLNVPTEQTNERAASFAIFFFFCTTGFYRNACIIHRNFSSSRRASFHYREKLLIYNAIVKSGNYLLSLNLT